MVDARMLGHSGIGTYLRGLLREYEKAPFFQECSLGLALPPSLFSQVGGSLKLFAFDAPVYSMKEQAMYPFQLKKSRLWHASHYNIPLLKQGARLIVTVHDLIHWIFRKEFYSPLQSLYAQIFFKKVTQLADRIIAVSHQTRDDLIQFFGASPEKIRVIYEGVTPEFFEPWSEEEKRKLIQKYQLPDRFFLYVGLLKPHKNVKFLAEVFLKLRKEGRIHSDLVIVGKKDQKFPLPTGEGLHCLSQVGSRKELAGFYASARALVHPSFYEGFGLTCLEAMASGAPVIVSRVASLPEVVGEAGYYVDPYSEESLRQAILELEENDTLCRELSEKGKLRARQFNWPKAAKETIEVYKEVLSLS